MKDELIKLLRRAEKDKPYPDELTEQIMYLIAPELDAARKWDEVIKISKSLKVLCTSCNYSVICEKSPSYLCDAARDLVIAVFDALTEKEPT